MIYYMLHRLYAGALLKAVVSISMSRNLMIISKLNACVTLVLTTTMLGVIKLL